MRIERAVHMLYDALHRVNLGGFRTLGRGMRLHTDSVAFDRM